MQSGTENETESDYDYDNQGIIGDYDSELESVENEEHVNQTILSLMQLKNQDPYQLRDTSGDESTTSSSDENESDSDSDVDMESLLHIISGIKSRIEKLENKLDKIIENTRLKNTNVYYNNLVENGEASDTKEE